VSVDWFSNRMRASTLSVWELGDLLGVHPHLLDRTETHIRLVEQPVRVIIELAARLDVHPADLVPGFDVVLANRRQRPKRVAVGQLVR
jgi:hypothetical protein